MVLHKYGLSEDDYVDLGYIALCEAALYYKPEKGSFSTIATTFIKHEFFRKFENTRKHSDDLNTGYDEEFFKDALKYRNYSIDYGFENFENRMISKDICQYLETTLTGKDLLVYNGIKEGLNTKQMSEKYNIPYHTLAWHRRRLREIIKNYWKDD